MECVKHPGSCLVVKQPQAPFFNGIMQDTSRSAAYITEREGKNSHQKDKRFDFSLKITGLQHPSVEEERGGKYTEQYKKIISRVYDSVYLMIIENIPLKNKLEHTETPLSQKKSRA